MDADTLESVRARYLNVLASLGELSEKMDSVLRQAASAAGVSCHVSVRTKDVASLLKKIVTKRYDDPWSQLTDKVGARVVVQRASDVDVMCRALQTEPRLTVIAVEDKRPHEPGQFDYSGIHLRTTLVHNPEHEVEIQIRTAAQDVWSDVSHTLLYKPVIEAPGEVHHAVLRLLALVEVIDEEVERVMSDVEARPDYAVRLLHRIAETRLLGFVATEHDIALSTELLEALLPTISPDELPGYAARLDEYLASRRPALEQMYADHGPTSGVADEPAYLMLSQPETLVFLERLTAAPESAVASWRPKLPSLMLRTLVALSGEDVDVEY